MPKRAANHKLDCLWQSWICRHALIIYLRHATIWVNKSGMASSIVRFMAVRFAPGARLFRIKWSKTIQVFQEVGAVYPSPDLCPACCFLSCLALPNSPVPSDVLSWKVLKQLGLAMFQAARLQPSECLSCPKPHPLCRLAGWWSYV